MPQIQAKSKLIDHKKLHNFCAQLLEKNGMSPDDAACAATILVETSLRGIDSHGVARLPHYLRRLEKQSVNPQPNMQTEILGSAIARLDGDHGLGHLVMRRASQEAIKLAKKLVQVGLLFAIRVIVEPWHILG